MRMLKLVAVVVASALTATVVTLLVAATGDAPGDAAAAQEGAPTATANALGGGTTESSFVAITPCRIVDTRQAGGKLQVGASRNFDVRGGGAAFAAQGGKAGGCAIPDSATGIEATVTAVDAASGFLRLWPAGQSQPNATFLNYDDAFNVSNTGALKVCDFFCSGTEDVTARAYGNATHLVIDVQGYYDAPIGLQALADGSIVQSSRVVSVSKTSTGSYDVVFDRSVRDCALSGMVGRASTSVEGFASIQMFNALPTYARVNTFDESGAQVDRSFHLTATC